MTIRVALQHHTAYHYDRFITLAPHIVRLRPAPHCRTPILSYSLKIQPESHFINWQQDAFSNYLARLVFQKNTKHLTVEVDVVADLTPIDPFDFFLTDEAQDYPFVYSEAEKIELAPYLLREEAGPRVKRWLKGVDVRKRYTIYFLSDLLKRLQQDIAYTVRMEPGVQTPEETLEKASGSCRDSAWLLVQILRHLGLAARFVSGYLVQLVADVPPREGPAGPKEDFTDLHAWTEVYLPGAGWIGLDPTSGLFASEGHIPLACTPTPGSASAITGGFFGEAETEFSFFNKVSRLYETPRVTKPYTPGEWQLMDALGQQVERRLIANDLRLTMGGEPTFVADHDQDAPEWNTTADSPKKRALAWALAKKLHLCFAPQGVIHYGQGKWYPGEPLPRWRYSVFFRKDGQALWKNPALLADPSRPAAHQVARQLADFAELLAKNLRLAPDACLPAFEDPIHSIWQEFNFPEDFDFSQLKEQDGRRRLLKQLEGGLAEPQAYVLPLSWDFLAGAFYSSHWQLQRGRLFLIPGDSPAGLRLPLERVQGGVEPPDWHEQDVFGNLPPLPIAAQSGFPSVPIYPQAHGLNPDYDFEKNEQAEKIAQRFLPRPLPRTALLLEIRDGHLYVFLPPTQYLEHYLILLAAVEKTAAALDCPVILEGYEPPNDPRLQRLAVTPDPGVIEVNIHPAASWSELTKNVFTLYAEAQSLGLVAEKFMLDGRHSGTGGGNHVTLGGITPADSPLLRRPDLLRSFLTFWQHHPGLSFLFSSLFIGPTSQSPRVDEGRQDTLYELEIAFQELERVSAEGQPSLWLVDRLFRNLLVDLTGNTHRAEFCIDKLYSPDSPSGRQGLLELRAFEMPPHPEMSLLQALLVRALLVHFWEKPYNPPKLVRWGTALYDRFMLPEWTLQDVAEVCTILARAGLAFDKNWLLPFFEFRFPKYGEIQVDGITLELRMALEPWHVLGEEMAGGGTARFVDSSLERLQCKVSGLTDSRYVVTCNGRRLPLHNTGRQGEYVAGVRYRAWQPPSALHPSIGIHAPLVFDIIDTWHNRAIGGCTYHVVHPGGRSHENFPVNSFVAAARRGSRFQVGNHSQEPWQPSGALRRTTFLPYGSGIGPMQAPAAEAPSEFPNTLDLRRQH